MAQPSGSNGQRKDPNYVRISTSMTPMTHDTTEGTFTRYLLTNAASNHIRDAFQKVNTTQNVRVAGIGTTKTGYLIRFRDEQSAETARNNTTWLQELGNGTKIVKPHFGVVVYYTPTDEVTFTDDKT